MRISYTMRPGDMYDGMEKKSVFLLKHGIMLLIIAGMIFFGFGIAAASSEHGDSADEHHAGEHASAEEHSTAGHEAGAHDGEHHKSKGWVATDTYKVMNFAVLAIGLFFVVRKPASQFLNTRIKDIETQIDDLEKQKREAEKKLSEYSDKLSKLEKEAEKIIADYVKQGEEAKTRILKEAEETAVRLEEQAGKNIEHEFEVARKKLHDEIMEKAILKAEEKIKSSINSNDQDNLVVEYLKKVVA